MGWKKVSRDVLQAKDLHSKWPIERCLRKLLDALDEPDEIHDAKSSWIRVVIRIEVYKDEEVLRQERRIATNAQRRMRRAK